MKQEDAVEIIPDCDPSYQLPQLTFQPPPRHPGRLMKKPNPSPGDRPKSPPMHALPPQPAPPIPRRTEVKYPQPQVSTVEFKPGGERSGSMTSMQRPPSRDQRMGSPPRGHPPRMHGHNSSLNNPRWSAFPSPPEGPPQPPPNRPLPQLPPTPSDSLRSRKSSGASKVRLPSSGAL